MTDRWEEWTWESMCMFHGMFALRVCVSRAVPVRACVGRFLRFSLSGTLFSRSRSTLSLSHSTGRAAARTLNDTAGTLYDFKSSYVKLLTRARTVLLAPPLLPSVAGRCTQDLDPCFGKGAADPRDVLGHRPLPNLFVNGPRPGLAWCVAHNLWVRRPAKVRIFQSPWGRARHRWDAVLELEPALTKAMLVDVEGEATLLGTEGPDSACVLRRPTMQLRARAPPALAAPTLHAARSLVRPACRATLACVTHFEAQAPNCRSVTRVTSVLMSVAQLVERNAGARATGTVHDRA